MKTRKRSTSSAFGTVFRKIRKSEPFASPPMDDLPSNMFDALVAGAIAKCIDFNVSVNRARKHSDEEFVFVSALRGICEDLIYLNFIRLLPSADREIITLLLMRQNYLRGLEVQSAFFAANNPYQPVLGPPKSEKGDSTTSNNIRKEIRAFWRSRHVTISGRSDGPSVKDMASKVGLTYTYDYIYFASSNFCHFHPQSLLRMGWGDLENPFYFSTKNMSQYYKQLSSLYGAMLFIGFYSAFSSTHFQHGWEAEVAKLFEIIDHVQRWPEVVTFEEMNKKPPLFLMTHALKMVAQKGDDDVKILSEVRNLSQLGKQ